MASAWAESSPSVLLNWASALAESSPSALLDLASPSASVSTPTQICFLQAVGVWLSFALLRKIPALVAAVVVWEVVAAVIVWEVALLSAVVVWEVVVVPAVVV